MGASGTVAGAGVTVIKVKIAEGRLVQIETLIGESVGGGWYLKLPWPELAVLVDAYREREVTQAALAEALTLLRAFGYELDALDIERRHALEYSAPEPTVRVVSP